MTATLWTPGDPIHDPLMVDATTEQTYSLKGDHCHCWRGRRTPSSCVDQSPDAATWPMPMIRNDLEARQR